MCRNGFDALLVGSEPIEGFMKKKISLILFYSGILFFILYISLRITLAESSLQFKDDGRAFDLFELFAIPIAIISLLFGIVLIKQSNPALKTLLVIGAFVSATIVFVMLLMSSFLNLCNTDYTKLYINKKDPSLKIVESSFECGAFDGSANIKHIVQIKEYPFGLITVNTADTTNIRMSNWLKVN